MKYNLMLAAFFAAAVLIVGCAKNQKPVIDSVKALPEEVSPGTTTELTVYAHDPERGKLKYTWKAKDGSFSASKDSATVWTAPDKPGNYKLTVKVTDPKGASSDTTVTLNVPKGGSAYTGSLQPDEPATRKARAPRETQPRKTPRRAKTK